MIVGYIIILGIIWACLRKKYGNGTGEKGSLQQFVFAGGKIPVWLLSTSVFSAWLWVTTIIGSAEAFLLYGLTGAIGYVIGASISFLFFIPAITGVFRFLPEAASFLEFAGKRFGTKTKNIFYIFAIMVAAYVLIEQAVGVAWVLERMYGTSYKYVAFLVVMIAAVFVVLAGMRGVLIGEFMGACIVITSFLLICGLLRQDITISSSLSNFFSSFSIAKQTGASFHDLMNDVVLIAGIRYFVVAIIIAFSQLLFDPAYYLKAKMAKNNRQLWTAFLIGGVVLWVPIGLASALVIGILSSQWHLEVTDLFSGGAAILFSVLILCSGMTAITHYLTGMMGIFSVDYYSYALKSEATDGEKIRFGRVMTLLIGTFCALIAISLENISLLTIDMFCSVFFAAPCAPLLMGLVSQKSLGNIPVVATIGGLISGFAVWTFLVSDDQWAWFFGTVTSFTVPLVIMILADRLSTTAFDFRKLREE